MGLFFLNVICVVTAGDLFSKKGECKTFSIAKLCHQRSSSWKHCQSYKENTCLRNFPLCIVAALLIFQSEAVPGSERKKGKASSGRGCTQGRHGPGAHTETGMHCCAAQLGLGAGLAAVWSLICRFSQCQNSGFSAQEGGSNKFFPATAQAP